MSERSNVLVLGGGVYQVPLIRAVQGRGMRAVVASVPGPYPGIALADEFVPVNTTDVPGVLRAARERNVRAVVTTGTDVALRSLGAVVDELSLAGPTSSMAARATNKLDMKRAFLEGGVRTPEFREARTVDEALAAWDALAAPDGVMVKCPDRSGSRGIVLARRRSDVPDALLDAVGASVCGYAVVEDFVRGHEVGVDGYVGADGEVAFLAPHDKLVRGNGRTDVPVGHRMDGETVRGLVEGTDLPRQMALTARAVGMRSCFFNMDVLIDEGGRAWVIEAGVRAGATCIPEVVGGYYGFDYYEAVVDAALGAEPSFPRSPARGASEGRLLVCDRPCRARRALPESVLSPLEGRTGLHVEASLDYAPGEGLPAFADGTSRVGQVVCVGDDPRSVSDALDEAARSLLLAYAEPVDPS